MDEIFHKLNTSNKTFLDGYLLAREGIPELDPLAESPKPSTATPHIAIPERVLPQMVSFYPEEAETVLTSPCVAKKRLREEADDYPNVVVKLNPRWRVIRCRDGIQWILQSKGHSENSRWRGIQYCRSKRALLQRVRQSCQEVTGEAQAILDTLPAWVEVQRNVVELS